MMILCYELKNVINSIFSTASQKKKKKKEMASPKDTEISELAGV